MSPAHITNIAAAMCKPSGISCRYEWDRDKRQFRWAFYRCDRKLTSARLPAAVLRIAQKLIDIEANK